MKISFKLDSISLKMKCNIVNKLKFIAQNAIQFITCGHVKAICGEFRCSEEVPITQLTDIKK